MKKVTIIFTILVSIAATSVAQLDNAKWGNETRRIVNGKQFRVLFDEVVINKTVDEVWNDVAGNFTTIGEITKSINFTRSLSGDTLSGLGAARLCNINIQGKTIEIKERIIDYKECGDHREFTYDVYESTGGPVKTYATWSVRKGEDGKTYLRSAFIFRANFGPITGLVERQLKKAGLRAGVLVYKHYLETGEKNVDAKRLLEMYPI